MDKCNRMQHSKRKEKKKGENPGIIFYYEPSLWSFILII
jgi:hypothetical protein